MGGVQKITKFLNEKFIDAIIRAQSEMSEKGSTSAENVNALSANNNERQRYKMIEWKNQNKDSKATLSIQFSEKDANDSEEEELYSKQKGKCPKLAISRRNVGPIGPHYYQSIEIPSHYQSAKYLHPRDWMNAKSKSEQIEKMRMSYFKDVALKKHKDMLQKCDKMIQSRKYVEIPTYLNRVGNSFDIFRFF